LLISQLWPIGWNCQLLGMVCQNCWIPTETHNLLMKSLHCTVPSYVIHHFIPVDFLWSILVPQQLGNETVTTHRAPYGWKAYIWQSVVWCPNGIVCDIAITISVPCSVQHNSSHLGFSGPEPCSHPYYITPSTRMPRVGFGRGSHGLTERQ
jgi:hypothetical protein